MYRLTLLVAMALLGIGLILAQNSSDPSNSSNPSVQPQSSATQQKDEGQAGSSVSKHHRNRDASSQPDVPDTTMEDRQSSTTSTTGVSGQNETPSADTKMGTTGSSPANPEPKQPAVNPQNGTSPDQQPNSSTGPETSAPHAQLLRTPAARAGATHTPDPGTCMNPAALQTNADGTQPVTPACR